jgi:hypothetical protein
MTAAAVLDREQGNTGGLGGMYGVFYALNRPSLPRLTHTNTHTHTHTSTHKFTRPLSHVYTHTHTHTQ